MSVTATRTTRQDPYPVGHPERKDSGTTRICTFPGCEHDGPLPATAEFFPVRKSGPKEGSFIGWCRAAQTLSAKRHKAEPERQGVRSRASAPTAYVPRAERASDLNGVQPTVPGLRLFDHGQRRLHPTFRA